MSEELDMEQVTESIWSKDKLSCDFLDSEQVLPAEKPRGVALGFFDGVHRGHKELLNALLYHCRQMDYEPAVFSFYRMPKKESFDTAEREYQGLIQVPEKRAAYLERYGIKHTWMQVFNDRFKKLSASDFVNNILYDRLGIRLIVAGDDFRFGHNRMGDAKFLQEWGAKKGVTVIIVPSVLVNKDVVSSTRIKNAIIEGDFRSVSRLLGHDYSMSGPVIRGNALGRTVGMPTANVAVPDGQLCPPYGVYITRTRVGDRIYPSVSNVGTRPTVNKKDYIPLLETCLLNMDINLYGQEIEVYFLDYVRPELTFPSFLSMSKQIAEDIEFANEWHRGHEELVLASRINKVPVYTLAAKRFNLSMVNIVFKDRLDERRSAANALAARIVSTASKMYPTRASLQLAADNLYGATLGSQVTRQGDLQAIWFYADGIRHAIDGSEPFADLLDILLNLLNNPLLDDEGLFDLDLFRTEQRNLIAEMKARRQDKSWYALNRSISLWTEGHAHAILTTGAEEVLANLTREEVTSAWHRLLREAQMQIFMAGDIQSEVLDKVVEFTKHLPENPDRLQMVPGIDPQQVDFPNRDKQSEYKTLEQSRLVMIYKGLPPYHFNQQILVAILNSMIGGDAHSLLFNSVREEHGLAYQISSMTLRFLNALIIQAGVAADDIKEVVRLIEASILDLQEGKVSEKLFNTSKRLLRSELLSITDNLSAMLFFHMENLSSGARMTITEALDDLEQLDYKQVCEAAKHLEQSFVFTYEPQNEEQTS